MFGEESRIGLPQGETSERSRLVTALKHVGRRKRSRILPLSDRKVRVDRSIKCHLRHTRDMALRLRVSVIKENILERIASGMSWK